MTFEVELRLNPIVGWFVESWGNKSSGSGGEQR